MLHCSCVVRHVQLRAVSCTEVCCQCSSMHSSAVLVSSVQLVSARRLTQSKRRQAKPVQKQHNTSLEVLVCIVCILKRESAHLSNLYSSIAAYTTTLAGQQRGMRITAILLGVCSKMFRGCLCTVVALTCHSTAHTVCVSLLSRPSLQGSAAAHL
jgi:hypothetical protein